MLSMGRTSINISFLYLKGEHYYTHVMGDKIPNLDQIPNILGYMVLEEDQIISVKLNLFYF